LSESRGDINAAVDILRKKGVATAATKGGREAREGVIAQFIQPGGRLGVLVEVNCETDFVAKNETFRAFCDEVASTGMTTAGVWLPRSETHESERAERIKTINKA
jgi:elongation factor Ts